MFKPLSKQTIESLTAFTTSCRRSIIQMIANAQSGHPGGSLGCIDYLSLLYTQIISKTGEKIIISNGHISPAVYAVLAELGYIPKEEVIAGFRKAGQVYEGHVSRHVPGVEYSTGPLGIGVSAAAGFALTEKPKKVFALIGDGESQEGQVYEMMNFAAKYKLDNFIVFMDYNEVQLSDGLKKIMPLHPHEQWSAAGWNVVEVDGHDYAAMWKGLQQAYKTKKKPTLLLGHTIMGKGVSFMEKEGRALRATWHGKAPSTEQATVALAELSKVQVTSVKFQTRWKPSEPVFPKVGEKIAGVKVGKPIVYSADELTDCRTAYGKALLDLAKKNTRVVALTADLSNSVKTEYVKDALPAQHIEVGVAEQHMISCAGGMSLDGFIPFASTFGVFMTSRAKDQARVNDINETNVKMVATHCGVSVGEDGPTHQAIDDIGSMLGLLNTMVMEPADPNQCDRMIRFIAQRWGNVYMRMGRHKIPVLTKENGNIFFDDRYIYEYGRCDLLRRGTDITIAASGSTVIEALQAHEMLKQKKISAEIVIMTSPKQFGRTLLNSIKKTKRVLTVEDHTTRCGYGSQLALELQKQKIAVAAFDMIGVDAYQLSGTAEALYDAAGISAKHIFRTALRHAA